jgi:three-Cys-motif partner protein
MKNFGGDWTEKKIEILIEYAKAYLVIMNKHSYWKLIYFDGFAGSGLIKKKFGKKVETIYGAAKRILDIEKPKPFDIYYFVEKENNTYAELIENTLKIFPSKKIYSVQEDCNTKLVSMAEFLTSKKGENYKALAYIDPYGMQLNWESISKLNKAAVDLWVLVPTGLGVNRLLKKNGKISESWYKKLEIFLGISRIEIDDHFYKEKSILTLFGEDSFVEKETNAILKAGTLYAKRLLDIFEFVSEPYLLKNSQNTIMYHFYMASNNKIAVKIANDIIKKYS